MSQIIFTCVGEEWRGTVLPSLCILRLILELACGLWIQSFLGTSGECPAMIKILKFLKISPVKSQMLRRPIINLV